jgi:2-polyprenyl-3-methyl-5-hydroxy-6-metoxy-1,4-benzoquinol methylase
MINLHKRSYEKEIMDAPDIPFPAIEQTLKELNIVNSRLGGHKITLRGVSQFAENGEDLVICEIGCGGGDNLQAIYQAFKKKNKRVSFIGIDMNPECIAYARQKYPDLPCHWICSDYALIDFGNDKPDIIFSSLFCHHFTDEQLNFMLGWLKDNSRKGFFINDLHRHWLAYYLIKYITRFFSRSYLVKNDAALSVARSFRKQEWIELFSRAGLKPPGIEWKWAFRWLVTHNNAISR